MDAISKELQGDKTVPEDFSFNPSAVKSLLKPEAQPFHPLPSAAKFDHLRNRFPPHRCAKTRDASVGVYHPGDRSIRRLVDRDRSLGRLPIRTFQYSMVSGAPS